VPNRSPAQQVFHPETGKPICGAQLVNSKNKWKICLRSAGAGTQHKGYGKCSKHFGNTQASGIGAARIELGDQYAAQGDGATFGGVVRVDPHDALLWLVRRTAGIVAWLDWKIQQFENDDEAWQDVGVTTETGGSIRKIEAVWIKMHGDERDRLARYAKLALDAGVAERQIQIAEEQGLLFANGIRQIFDRLELTPAQQKLAPGLVREVLLGLDQPAIETTGVLQ
jgi:hypothetical protein